MIKFRAWEKSKNKMHDVYQIEFGAFGFIGFNKVLVNEDFHLVDDRIILEQSTGVLDKNGKEIFEGDIVEYYTDDLGVISFFAGGFIVRSYKYDYFDHIGEAMGEMKIIGNIHEHSHLLEER